MVNFNCWLTVCVIDDDIENAEDYVHIKEESNISGDIGADEKMFFHDTSIDYSANDDTSGGDNNGKTGTSGSISAGIDEESDEQLKKRLKVEPLE